MDKFFTGLGISLIIFGSFLVYQRNNPNRIAFAKSETVEQFSESKELSTPNRIVINELNIDLPVVPSKITNGKWEVTDKGVSFLETSVIPGQVGNSVLYGHNWTNILGGLINIKTGETIELFFENGTKKDFVVTLIQEVKPNDISILDNTTDTRITLYTCSGFLDSKRFVVVALLK